MRNRKITEILSCLSEQDWRSCYKYLKYCNNKESKSLKAFEYLNKFRNNILSDKLTSQELKKKVDPNLSEKALNNLLSDLTQDIESFLVHRELNHPSGIYDRTRILANFYKRKGNYKCFESKLAALGKVIKESREIDIFKDLKTVELNHMHYFSEINQKKRGPTDILRKAEMSRQRFSENLKQFYAIEEYNIKIQSGENLHQADKKRYNLLEEILDQLWDLLKNKNSNSFNFLEKTLFEKHDLMSPEISEAITIYLINHCLHEAKSGKSATLKNLSQLYSFGLETGILLFGGKLSEIRFLTIVEVIAKFGKDQEAEIFIPQWIDHVETRERQSVENVAYAHWYFATKRYAEAISKINLLETKLTNTNLSFRTRWISICSMCVLYPGHEGRNEITAAAYTFFRRHRNKVNKVTYKGSMNLVKLVELIWGDADLPQLKEYITHSDYLIFRTWAHEYINEREKKGPM